MQYTMLGDTPIPKIAMGTWSWGTGPIGGNQIFGNHLQETDLKPVFDRAVEAGFTLWDTAPVFGMGAAESILGKLSHCDKKNEILISTKFSPFLVQTRHAMEHSLEKSLHRLGTEHADLFWIHTPKNVKKWTNELIPLMREGKFRYAGVSNHNLEEIQQAAEILGKAGLRLAAVQNHYSLLYRVPELTGILDWCHKNRVVFFSYMVLEQGALTTRYSPNQPFPKWARRGKLFSPSVLKELSPLITLMNQIGKKYRADAAQIAIAWAIAKDTVPIVGITKPHQVVSDAKAVQIRLTPKEIAQLEQVADDTGIHIPGFWEKTS